MMSPDLIATVRGHTPADRSPAGRSSERQHVDRRSAVVRALASCRGAFLAVGLFSGVVNLLMLTGSFFMLQVYDRVLTSRSVPTLAVLLVLVAVLFAFQGLIDFVRTRILLRCGERLDRRLREDVFDAVAAGGLRGAFGGDGAQAVRDLDQMRQFLSGSGPVAISDLPWVPLYLAIAYLFHPWLGHVAVAGVLLLCAFTLVSEAAARGPTARAAAAVSVRNAVTAASRRNAEAIAAMGMGSAVRRLWDRAHARYLDETRRGSDTSGALGALSKVTRYFLQSLTLATGAYLVIGGELSPGVMIATSIIASRALAPIELAIANWRGFVGARQSYARLARELGGGDQRDAPTALPLPGARIEAADLVVAVPGGTRPILAGIGFALRAGEALGVIGPSAAGKSSLARVLVGAWPPAKGEVRLDGATIGQWDEAARGRIVGYLPQDVQLFDGTIAENIARFAAGREDRQVVAAARAAGVHDMVVRLPEGYETRIGEAGGALSGGQRQRVALARALYGDPFLVVLDEPSSNLDAEGDAALAAAIAAVRARGGIAVVIAHRPSTLAAVDKVLVLGDGRQQAFGPKDEVLRRVLRPVAAAAPLPRTAGAQHG